MLAAVWGGHVAVEEMAEGFGGVVVEGFEAVEAFETKMFGGGVFVVYVSGGEEVEGEGWWWWCSDVLPDAGGA